MSAPGSSEGMNPASESCARIRSRSGTAPPTTVATAGADGGAASSTIVSMADQRLRRSPASTGRPCPREESIGLSRALLLLRPLAISTPPSAHPPRGFHRVDRAADPRRDRPYGARHGRMHGSRCATSAECMGRSGRGGGCRRSGTRKAGSRQRRPRRDRHHRARRRRAGPGRARDAGRRARMAACHACRALDVPRAHRERRELIDFCRARCAARSPTSPPGVGGG